MTIIELLILGVIVGSNNFAVALALGALGQVSKCYRVMLVFGGFEFFVPLFGIWLGSQIAGAIGFYAIYVGSAMLVGLGILAVTGALREGYDDEILADRATRWSGLLILGASLSLDNLLVGFSLGLGENPPLAVAGAIAFFSILFTWLGMHIGNEYRRRWEKTAKISTGVLLILLGIATGAGWI